MSVPNEPRRVPVFRPDFFTVASLEEAMSASLAARPNATTQDRWQRETQYHLEDLEKFVKLAGETRVLDFGCGPGRMSKAIIDCYGSRVFGVDSSPTMASIASEYVLSERFSVWSPAALDKMVERGFQVDFCICLWVIQHVPSVPEVIARIKRALRPGGVLYALNETTRWVPTDLGWVNDGVDVAAELRREFAEVDCHVGPPTAFPPTISKDVVIQVLRKA